MRESAIAFCDRFGAEAYRLGWTAPQLFALHPEHGTVRFDVCGVMMIGADPASGVEADRILFERTAGYRIRPGQTWDVPVWKFAKLGVGQ